MRYILKKKAEKQACLCLRDYTINQNENEGENEN